ncbi:MAG: efflux RND transporter permease subunit [Desulfobacterales bacterium]|nr:efflux RND transporter permease subunit [Desulfobacterales bacterium]
MMNFFSSMLSKNVFANVIMVVILVGGLLSSTNIKQELMPAMEPNQIEISVGLKGASPAEINTSVLMVIENTVRGMDGIKRVDAVAREGVGNVTITLLENIDQQKMLNDIKSSVEGIETFPKDADKPLITIPSQIEKALSIVIYGKQPKKWLRNTAEQVRYDLRTQYNLKRAELAFPGDHEISVEISEHKLRELGLTLEEIAEKIRKSTPDLPGGTIYSRSADIVVRTSERRELAQDFENIVITQTSQGIPLKLSDVAILKDGFGGSSIECWFNGKPAIQLDVYAASDESPISVEKAVKRYISTFAKKKYKGVSIEIFENQASDYRNRVMLLIDNAIIGLILVLLILGLFLTPHLAFWVMVGIPTSLLGGLLILPLLGGTLNLLSLFAFIVTIGVVVDDAIMIGEAICVNLEKGMVPLKAATMGLKEMGGMVLLATFTTIIAFMPMFFVPGDMGILFYQIPAVVVSVLIVSLFESLFILGAHLSMDHPESRWLKFLSRPQKVVNEKLENFIEEKFRPFIMANLKHPETLYVSALTLLLLTIGAIAADLLEFDFTPTIESDTVIAQAALPYGTPRKESIEIQKKLVTAAYAVLEKNKMKSPGIFSLIGTRLEEGEVEIETLAGSHYISVLMSLPPEEERILSGRKFASEWERQFGDYNKLESLNFTGEKKVTGGEPIMLELFHPDPEKSRAAAVSLGNYLRIISGLTSIDDGVRTGKSELKIKLKDTGLQMGLTSEEVAKQVRHRYHGAEAVRFVRDGNEVRVMVRMNRNERSLVSSLTEAEIKNPSGFLIPLTEVAEIKKARSFTSLNRRDGKKIYTVTADIGFGIDDDVIEDTLEDVLIPKLIREFPELSVTFAGEEEENDEALGSLGNGFLVVLVIIFLMLVFHYNSYKEPLLILSVIPFSMIGAVWGHIVLNYELSIISVIGIIAMTGVVVNDSLVLVTTYKRLVSDGFSHYNAIVEAACKRFRPILLTTLTTFFGLVPLLLETSEQAQFLIPAAVSLSFGLIFGTVITLVLIPGFILVFASK